MVGLLLLCLPALGLTVTMFATRNMMLGFPSAIFWGILGGYAYIQSAATWDWQYILFFASMGMVIFSLFAAFALRKKDLAGPDADKGKFIDETDRQAVIKPRPENVHLMVKRDWGDIDHLDMYSLSDKDTEAPDETRTAKQVRERVHDRAKRRKAKVSWGEFR
jgi:hypothetical protein